MAQLKGSQALFRSLEAQGVDVIFGLIGAHTMELFDALYDFQNSIRLITTRDERAAALMADGYGRSTGRPGVCLTSTGPGAANSMSGLGEAYFSFSPVLNITSTAEEHLYGRGLGANHETVDQLGMLSTVSRWSHHMTGTEEIPDRIYEAFRRLRTERPQPISIEMPADIQAQVAEVEVPTSHGFSPPQGDPRAIERAVGLLLKGQRIAIWAGTGVDRSGASQELIKLATTLGVPVFTTPGGKPGISQDHPLNVGVLGGPGGITHPEYPLKVFLSSLDTLLVVGSSLRYTSTKAQGLQLPPNLIHVDISDEPMGKNYEPTVEVVGDAKAVLSQLTQGVQGRSAHLVAGFDSEIKELKGAVSRYLWEAFPNPMRTMYAIRSAVGPHAIFTGDASISAVRANACLPVYEPRTYLPPVWGGLGFAFPAAMGVKAGIPDRPVVCITGDGGFQFNVQELGTCVQYGLNPIVLVFNDNAWGSTRQRQRVGYNGRYIGTELKNPDFVRLAEAFGANGARVGSVEELGSALEEAAQSKTVSVIEVSTPDGFDSFS